MLSCASMAEYGVLTLALVDGASFNAGSAIIAEYALFDRRAGRSSMVSANVMVKANANYACSRCSSTENVQAHHRVPGDDSSLIVLCGECHSNQHPNIPKGLITCVKSHQPYWCNKSAGSIARELGVHTRTIIRVSRRLGIPQGSITMTDLARLASSISIIPPRRQYDSLVEIGYCPFCKSLKLMRKAGMVVRVSGLKQRWECTNRLCRRMTVNPLLEKV